MEQVITKLNEIQPSAISRLRQAVEIPSISNAKWPRSQVMRMAEFLKQEFESLEMSVSYRYPQADATLCKDAEHPPVLFAASHAPTDIEVPTVLIYGHYDVQPAQESDGWSRPPFEFYHDPQKGIMWGRGVTDDKGPLMGWLSVLRAFRETSTPLPARVVFCLEGLEEVGSTGLRQVLEDELRRGEDGYLDDISAIAISDNYWLGTTKPCLTYGLRGIAYFSLGISSRSGKDLHSGYGGQVQEPLHDLLKLLASLTDEQGNIAITGVESLHKPISPKALKFYEDVQIDVIEETKHAQPFQSLIAGWHDSALTYHGIEGAYSDAGGKTVIPGCVKGKFSIRTQSGLDLSVLIPLIESHLRSEYGKLKTKNTMKLSCIDHEPGWDTNPDHWNFACAAKAVRSVWGVDPDYTREGGTIPVTSMLGELFEDKSIVLIPIGRGDDGAHSTDEKLNVENFANGCKVFALYLAEVGIWSNKQRNKQHPVAE